jgi:hypothetical protein
LSPTARTVLGAAAAVALLALLVPVLGRLGQSSDDDSASFDSTGSAIEGGAGDAATAEDSGSGATSSTAVLPTAGDLGTYADLDALVDALLSSPQDLVETEPPNAFEPDACAIAINRDGANANADAATAERATATIAGDAVIVVVRDAESGARTLVVYRADDCTILRQVPL